MLIRCILWLAVLPLVFEPQAAGGFDLGAMPFGTLPPAPVPYLIGGQSTVVWQYHPSFHSPYTGPNSFRAHGEDALSHSYTLYAGARLLPWLEVYVNPEMIRGSGVSNGLGIAGYTNGEVIRNPSAGQDPYLARAFLRATVPLGTETETVDTDLYQIAGERPQPRLVVTLGVLAVTDIFDTNRYANSTRNQFLNWALINNLAYDFAADTRGYSRGFAVEWNNDPFAIRGGMFQMPTTANGLNLDDELLDAHGDQIEIEARRTLLPGQPTVVRLLGYHNQASMGNYRNAVALAQSTGGTPDITRTRRRGTEKWGFGINLEQPLSADGNSGAFARLGWNDDTTESFAFTEAGRSVSAGAQIAGDYWKRAADRIGIAGAFNDISNAHAGYLRAGGLGFILGDGRLDRRAEALLELYYRLELVPWFAVTFDYQFVADPGYNADRGPVSVFSVRVHLEAVASSAEARHDLRSKTFEDVKVVR